MSNFALNFNMFCDMIGQIIDYNKDFVVTGTEVLGYDDCYDSGTCPHG